jgi:hypothetical protein
MKTAHFLSRLLFLLIGALLFQLAPASPPNSSDSDTLAITQDGSVKLKSELGPAETAIRVIPLTSTNNGTLTVGNITPSCSNNVGVQFIYGFASGLYGSYSPTSLTGGDSVVTIADNTPSAIPPHNCGYSAFSELSVSGFSSSPGSSWLSSITCNGVNKTGAGGAFFYSSGTASWGMEHAVWTIVKEWI